MDLSSMAIYWKYVRNPDISAETIVPRMEWYLQQSRVGSELVLIGEDTL
jgi:hypothetical protein